MFLQISTVLESLKYIFILFVEQSDLFSEYPIVHNVGLNEFIKTCRMSLVCVSYTLLKSFLISK